VHYKQKTAAKLNAQQKAVGSEKGSGAWRSSDNEQVSFSLRCQRADKLNGGVLIVLTAFNIRTGAAVPNLVSQDKVTTAVRIPSRKGKYARKNYTIFVG